MRDLTLCTCCTCNDQVLCCIHQTGACCILDGLVCPLVPYTHISPVSGPLQVHPLFSLSRALHCLIPGVQAQSTTQRPTRLASSRLQPLQAAQTCPIGSAALSGLHSGFKLRSVNGHMLVRRYKDSQTKKFKRRVC